MGQHLSVGQLISIDIEEDHNVVGIIFTHMNGVVPVDHGILSVLSIVDDIVSSVISAVTPPLDNASTIVPFGGVVHNLYPPVIDGLHFDGSQRGLDVIGTPPPTANDFEG